MKEGNIMSMEKYATYRIFEHKQTGKVVRVARTGDTTEREKVAQYNDLSNWIELDQEPSDD